MTDTSFVKEEASDDDGVSLGDDFPPCSSSDGLLSSLAFGGGCAVSAAIPLLQPGAPFPSSSSPITMGSSGASQSTVLASAGPLPLPSHFVPYYDVLRKRRETWSNFPAGLRVLVTDNDPASLQLTEKILKKCDYQGALASPWLSASLELRSPLRPGSFARKPPAEPP